MKIRLERLILCPLLFLPNVSRHIVAVMENFLVVQRLGLCDPTAGGLGSAPGWGVEIPQATQCSQKSEAGATKKKLRQCEQMLPDDSASSAEEGQTARTCGDASFSLPPNHNPLSLFCSVYFFIWLSWVSVAVCSTWF